MTTYYLTDVEGDGSNDDPFCPKTNPPILTLDSNWVVVMIDEEKRCSIIVADDDTLSGPGVIPLLSGSSIKDLRVKASESNPSQSKRASVNGVLASKGFLPSPQNGTWRQVIHQIAREVNPDVSLDVVGFGKPE